MITGVQQFMLGTVLRREAQARQTLAAVKAAGYDGLELCDFMLRPMGLGVRLLTRAAGMPTGGGAALDWPALLQQAGLQAISLHVDLGSLERDAAAVAAQAARLGTDRVVITGMYRFAYADAAAWHDLARRLNAAGQALSRAGARLLYHNHNCELLPVEGTRRGYDILCDETDPSAVNFELDSYWFAEGGADVAEIMRRLGSRMKLWHINDRGTRLAPDRRGMTPILRTDSVELGTGNLPLRQWMALAEANGVEAVVLESHRNWLDNSPVASLTRSAQWLHAHR